MLCDAGPLIALVDYRLPEHKTCAQILSAAPKPLLTSWACMVEAMHAVYKIGGSNAQENLWAFHNLGALTLYHHSDPDVPRMQVLMRRYQNVPMDLADATLMVIAESTGDRRIFTLDSDFRIYRFDDGGFFDVVS